MARVVCDGTFQLKRTAPGCDREGYLWVIPQIPDSMATALDLFDPEDRYLARHVVSAPIQGASPGLRASLGGETGAPEALEMGE